MKILLLGANGQVGTELRRSLLPLGEIFPATRSGSLGNGVLCETVDLGDADSLVAMVGRIGPDAVVNAAAYTAVDRAESDAQAAYRANAEAPAAIAAACKARDALLVHYSTDYVFDGTATRPYREDDHTSPLGVYGASKLAGEEAIRASGVRHLILRTAWVYAARGNNFLLTMLRLAKERDHLRVVADQVGTPTPASLIADVTAALLSNSQSASATLHLTADGQTSWHGFAEAIFATALQLGMLERAPRVEPVPTSAYPTPARRPPYSVLDTGALRRGHGLPLPEWREALHGVLSKLPR